MRKQRKANRKKRRAGNGKTTRRIRRDSDSDSDDGGPQTSTGRRPAPSANDVERARRIIAASENSKSESKKSGKKRKHKTKNVGRILEDQEVISIPDEEEVDLTCDHKSVELTGPMPLEVETVNAIRELLEGKLPPTELARAENSGNPVYFQKRSEYATNRKRLKAIALAMRNSDDFFEVPGMLDSGADTGICPIQFAPALYKIQRKSTPVKINLLPWGSPVANYTGYGRIAINTMANQPLYMDNVRFNIIDAPGWNEVIIGDFTLQRYGLMPHQITLHGRALSGGGDFENLRLVRNPILRLQDPKEAMRALMAKYEVVNEPLQERADDSNRMPELTEMADRLEREGKNPYAYLHPDLKEKDMLPPDWWNEFPDRATFADVKVFLKLLGEIMPEPLKKLIKFSASDPEWRRENDKGGRAFDFTEEQVEKFLQLYESATRDKAAVRTAREEILSELKEHKIKALPRLNRDCETAVEEEEVPREYFKAKVQRNNQDRYFALTSN